MSVLVRKRWSSPTDDDVKKTNRTNLHVKPNARVKGKAKAKAKDKKNLRNNHTPSSVARSLGKTNRYQF